MYVKIIQREPLGQSQQEGAGEDGSLSSFGACFLCK